MGGRAPALVTWHHVPAGGSRSAVTAVLVVNVPMEPVWVPWVLPIAIMTPVIVWWNRKVLNGRT